MIRIGSVVIRVDDLERQKAFWTAALGYVAREGDDDTFALLRPPDGRGPNLSLDRVRSQLQIPPAVRMPAASGLAAQIKTRSAAVGTFSQARSPVSCVQAQTAPSMQRQRTSIPSMRPVPVTCVTRSSIPLVTWVRSGLSISPIAAQYCAGVVIPSATWSVGGVRT